MNFETLFSRTPDKPVRAGLVGAGQFGATFLAQSRRIPSLTVPAVCDRDAERARGILVDAGHDLDAIVICDERKSAMVAMETNKVVVTADPAVLAELPIDVVVEATGDAESAAATALVAIENGHHSVLATKEAESVVGPILARKAAGNGVVHTLVDGDQPSLLVGLISWVRTLGLRLVCAGKASEYDVIWDAEAGRVMARGKTWHNPGYGEAFAGGITALESRRLDGFESTSVPDLCEMGIVANHAGLVPDRQELHAPIARTIELPDLFRPQNHGGLLGRTGAVDIFNCLRRPDELSFAGGVFATVEAPDRATGQLLAEKGIPATVDYRYFLMHNPVHLLGLEATTSILSSVRLAQSTGGAMPLPNYDLIALARRDLSAGERLAIGTRHEVEALDHQLRPASALHSGAPAPYYLIAGSIMRRPVTAGSVLTCDDVEIDRSGVIFQLRKEQDAAFMIARQRS